MKRRKKKSNLDDPNFDVKTMSHRVGPLVVETRTTTHSAVIDYADILDACEVVDDSDSDMGPPWKEHDGWEHELITSVDDKVDHHVWEKLKNSESVFYCRDHGGWCQIAVTRKHLEEWQGKFVRGTESRVVYEDRLAQCCREAIETLKNWYINGYYWYGVTCDYLDYSASLWGIQLEDDDSRDPYIDNVKSEITSEVVGELEDDGYEVINKPPSWSEPKDVRYQRQRRENFSRRLAVNMGFKKPDEYRAWVTDSAEHRRVAAQHAAEEDEKAKTIEREILEYLL